LTRRCLVAIAASVAFGAPVLAQDKSIVVASTTSTQDSGLFGHSVSSILISSTVATMPMHWPLVRLESANLPAPVICHLQCSFGPPYQNNKTEVLFECLYHASCTKLVLVGCAKPSFRTAPGRFCAHQEAHDY
jgi:hypothetical protein